MVLPDEDLGAAWRSARHTPRVVHLDSAACSRASRAVLDAVGAHARAEAELGGYVAEEAVAPVLRRAREMIASLVGGGPDDVAFVGSARDALGRLLAHWPLQPHATVACLPGEYGPNRDAFAAHGLRVAYVPADGLGRLDVDAFAQRLRRDPPALVHLTLVSSHRGVVQPAAAAEDVCRTAGVPLVIDAAQALGHVDTAVDADAIYATSRKWLAGPRGVGVLLVRSDAAARLRGLPRAPAEVPPARRLETVEAHVAGRVGLAAAVDEHLVAGPERVRRRLRALGRRARELLDGVGGWRVVEPVDEPSAITTLRPPADVHPAQTRARLLAEAGVLVTCAQPWRAPEEMTGPVLRVSPHVDATEAELQILAGALARLS